MRFILLAVAAATLAVACLAQSVPHFKRAPALPEIDYIPEAVTPSAPAYKLQQLQIRGNIGQGRLESGLAAFVRQTVTPTCVTGSKSKICIFHEPLSNPTVAEQSRYLQAQAVFNEAARLWADVFPSKVEIRIQSQWRVLGANVLGSAGPTTFWNGHGCGTQAVSNSLYSPAVLNSLLGIDYNGGSPLPYHISMVSTSAAVAIRLETHLSLRVALALRR
jgi:hypothetical protein